ncbi:GNAT family N-acetyltransferase [Microvirga terrae]|uniref:GNAT family N-acetyltransferase n=1 Tax=Microvirga terrae TaxID=2740529 RepID=A0ABY5RKC3_9HYPH|nr:GNAT family N-acetyltransferase [Microvirga terrae]UVF17428.1 GNAT family N-acetyltransferase [Microvirga terrae]
MSRRLIDQPMDEKLSAVNITVEPDPDAFAGEIEERLLSSLRQNQPASDYAPFGILAHGRDGTIVGGLVGGTSYGWLVIKVLWVAEDLRSHGLGTRIMTLAEETVARQGCHGAWLDTSSRRAKSFYEKLGYELFATLDNQDGERPRGHARFFLRRRFPAVPA